jgi:hypothetical protein
MKQHIYPRKPLARNMLREIYDIACQEFPYGFRARDMVNYIQKNNLRMSRQQIWRSLFFIANDPRSKLIRKRKAVYVWQN